MLVFIFLHGSFHDLFSILVYGNSSKQISVAKSNNRKRTHSTFPKESLLYIYCPMLDRVGCYSYINGAKPANIFLCQIILCRHILCRHIITASRSNL